MEVGVRRGAHFQLVSRGIQQSKGNVGAADLYLADEEIAEIEGREINEPELVTAA